MTTGDCHAAKEQRLAETQGYRSGVKSAGAVEILAKTTTTHKNIKTVKTQSIIFLRNYENMVMLRTEVRDEPCRTNPEKATRWK